MIHRHTATASIARPVEDVFAWATTPGSLPHASPHTISIESSDPDRPLRAGDTFREHVRIGSWRGYFDWTAEALEAPKRCVLTGVSRGEGFVNRLLGHDSARIELTCSGDAKQTQITREVSYHVGLAELVGDLFLLQANVDAAANVTMTTMVSILENPLLHGPRPDSADEAWQHEADPLADAAVASLVSPSGDTTALERFIRVLYKGDPPADDLPQPMQRLMEVTATLPSWTCQPRLEAASDLFLDWGVLFAGALICASLPETYVLPRIAKLLNLTRELDADPAHTDRRLWFTARMAFDIMSRDGLGPGGEGRLALQRLRLIHAVVRLFVQHRLDSPHRLAKLSSAALWDTENGQPINQLELVYTLLTFSHVVLRSIDRLGAEITPYQREAYIHLWNVAGVQLGIRPELLPRDAADAARMFETLKNRYAAATPEAARLGHALVWYWNDVFPAAVSKEARELMGFVISHLLPPQTVAMNGLTDLPEFSPQAAHTVKSFLHDSGRFCANLFEDVAGARNATALFVSLLIRARTHSYEDESGTFDIPQEIYERWQGIPAG